MLQRIGVAQAMLNEPRLLFLDEPASGTDPLGVAVVRERILEAKRRGAPIVLNSHQLTEVERVCDRVLFLDHGRLTRDETLQGDAASRRRTAVRVPADRLEDAVRVLADAGVVAEPSDNEKGVLRLAESSDAQVSAAVKALALADVAVLEVRASAELEELFRESPAHRDGDGPPLPPAEVPQRGRGRALRRWRSCRLPARDERRGAGSSLARSRSSSSPPHASRGTSRAEPRR
jgi:ABC-2 type transport system ATP-binding protein